MQKQEHSRKKNNLPSKSYPYFFSRKQRTTQYKEQHKEKQYEIDKNNQSIKSELLLRRKKAMDDPTVNCEHCFCVLFLCIDFHGKVSYTQQSVLNST